MELPEELREGYKPICFIGGGGNGSCYLVSNNEKTEFYTLKIAKNSGSFHEEGEKTKNLSIPLKAKTHEYSSEDAKNSWILLDYIPGLTLAHLSNDFGLNLKPVLLFKILAALCNTVNKLHAQNIIHRDIKPDNIVIDGDFNAHLIDYGDIGEIPRDQRVRITESFHGTVPFQAPEVFCKKPTLKSDIFSIGATMFQMITNEYPFNDLYSKKRRRRKNQKNR